MSAGKDAADTTGATKGATMGPRPAHALTSGMISWSDPRLIAAILLLTAAGLVAAWLARSLGTPADLLAVWVAGEFWQMGRADEIYPPAQGLFTMLPPRGWIDWLAATQGYEDAVYPFLYPPLWAVVMGTVAPADFAPVAEASYWINAGLLAATVVLAIRATGALLDPVTHVVLVLVVFGTTHIASVGFLQGQPHILVAFLLVLAVERSRAGAQATAGAALALAASIKLFPLIYVVIWIARGERRALVSFALTGAALAAASVGLTGWPLHRAFLDSIGQIGRSLLLTGNSMSFDAVMGRSFLGDSAELVRGTGFDTATGVPETWRVAERPAVWAAIGTGCLFAVLVGAALAARRMPKAALYAGLWPGLLTLSVVFTPTGWIYYVIPAAVFAPVLLAGLPRARGGALFLIGLLLFYAGRLTVFRTPEILLIAEVYFYVAGALVWGLGFALLARRLADE
ncbi:MAG: DUF2029 domain-containing protein [Maritimibacter sp.]|nr:DUF2029 domain-containing protein [Maritimibacter sp.]